MKIFAFIFARGGSKGLKNKNLKKVKGVSLVARAIKQAKKIKQIDQVFVSSDEKKILTEGYSKGASTILRPKSLCKDNALEINSWVHAINYLKKKKINFDLMLVLPCTSPLRSDKDIIKCIKKFKKNLHMIMTVFKTKYHPALNIVKKTNFNYIKKLNQNDKINQRQDVKNIYLIANSVYLFSPQKILNKPSLFGGKVIGVEIPKNRAIDIDDEIDLKICRTLL
tara:strand:- start:190 stop:861 length:672 start_codon:yes stop_codon:yes gene_type:complete